MKTEKAYKLTRAGREIKIVFHQRYYLLVFEDADCYASVICEELAANVFDDTAFYRRKNNWSDGALYLDKWLIKVDSKAEGEFIVREDTVGIANGAFKGCKKLQVVQFPQNITKNQIKLSGWKER